MFAGGTPDRSVARYWDSGTIPWLSSGEVNQWLIESPTTYITEEGMANSSATWIPSGSIVVALAGQGKTKGTVAQLAFAATCNQSLAAIIPSSRVHARYLLWWLAGHYETLRNLAGGEQRDGLNLEIIGSVPCPLPPIATQTAIADFLDAETAQIDSVIEKLRALLLRETERFQSAIFSLVCGFSVDGPRRSSGLAWQSAMPKTWQVRKLAWDYEIQLGKMLNPAAATGLDQRPYLANRDVQWDRVEVDSLSEMSFDDEEREHLRLRRGDLLVCEGGEVGRAAIWMDELPECYYQKAIHRLRPRREANPRFLMYCLWAAASRGVFAVEGNVSTVMHLTGEQLAAHRFPFPSTNEQASIVATLDQANKRWRKVTDFMTRQIELLQERRRALIGGTVTGQIPITGIAA